MAGQLRNPNARFVLDHAAKKAPCPSCGKRGTFRLYIDRHTGEHLPDHCGTCDRSTNCGYVYTAAQWLRDGGVVPDIEKTRMITPPPPRSDWRCPEEWVNMTFGRKPDGGRFATQNNLIQWMLDPLNDDPLHVFQEYNVGTYPLGKNYPQLCGAAVFWQMGQDERPRSGKVIQYDPETGKRRKDIQPNWMHTIITKQSMEDLGCVQCFFGEHLLFRRPNDPVAVVESEKTALICACLFPSHVWLATGGAHMLGVQKAMVLSGRDVFFFPDQGQLENWTARAMDIEPMLNSCHISDIMECIGALEGEDIADYLVPVNIFEKMEIDLFPAAVWKKIPESTSLPTSKEEYWAKFASFHRDQVRVDANDPRWGSEADINAFLVDAQPMDPEFEEELRPVIPPIVYAKGPIDRIRDLPGIQALEKEMPIDWSRAHIKPIQP